LPVFKTSGGSLASNWLDFDQILALQGMLRIHDKSVRDYECKASIGRKEIGARVVSEMNAGDRHLVVEIQNKCNGQTAQGISVLNLLE
jgi:hypothetical protein